LSFEISIGHDGGGRRITGVQKDTRCFDTAEEMALATTKETKQRRPTIAAAVTSCIPSGISANREVIADRTLPCFEGLIPKTLCIVQNALAAARLDNK